MDKLNNTSKLSVVIPCFNKEDYLIKMISCIMRQTFADWELILVDDGSTKESFNKVHDFVSTDGRIQHIHRHRLPKNGDTCRNIGMDMAKGEYIIIFDADDLITDNCFENRVRFMEEHPECDYATFPSGSFEDGHEEAITHRANYRIEHDILYNLLSAKYPFTVWGNIYRRSSLHDIRWDEHVYVYQDFDFMVQCAMANLKHEWALEYEDDYYYRIFRNGNSVCSNFISKEKCDSTLYLFDKTLKSISFLENRKCYYKAFRRFIVIHFERLVLGRMINEAEDYCQLLSQYYPDSFISELENIISICNKTSSDKVMKIKLHYNLYKKFHISLYKSCLIHEIVKFVLFK